MEHVETTASAPEAAPAPAAETLAAPAPKSRAERRAASVAAANAEAQRAQDAGAAEGSADGVPDAAERSQTDSTPTPAEPASSASERTDDAPEAEEAGTDDRPLSRRERDEFRKLKADVDRLTKETEDAKRVPEAPPGQPDPALLTELRSFVGLDDSDGRATYDKLSRLLRAKDWQGLADAKRPDGQIGYSAEEAIDQLNDWDVKQGIVQRTSGYWDAQAWGKIARHVDTHVAAVGLDAKQAAEAVKQAQAKGADPVDTYLTMIREAADKAGAERVQAEAKAEVKEWKDKYEFEQKAHKAARAGLAGHADAPESGRGNGALTGAAAVLQLAKKDRSSFTERALRGEFAGVDLSDH